MVKKSTCNGKIPYVVLMNEKNKEWIQYRSNPHIQQNAVTKEFRCVTCQFPLGHNPGGVGSHCKSFHNTRIDGTPISKTGDAVQDTSTHEDLENNSPVQLEKQDNDAIVPKENFIMTDCDTAEMERMAKRYATLERLRGHVPEKAFRIICKRYGIEFDDHEEEDRKRKEREREERTRMAAIAMVCAQDWETRERIARWWMMIKLQTSG